MSHSAPSNAGFALAQRQKVCALIDATALPDPDAFAANGNAHALLAENIERLRRQLDRLGVQEVFGLGDIVQGSSFMVLRQDVVFEFSALAALVQRPGCAAQFEDTLAAVHVEAGDAAAALAKFRRQDASGWQPFHIRFFRLGHFTSQRFYQRFFSLFGKARRGAIAKAALLRTDPYAQRDDQPVGDIWRALPGLDPFMRSVRAMDVQLLARDALGIRPAGWRGIGFLLILIMLSFGAFGWLWLGAVIALFAAGTFDLAKRAQTLEDLRLAPTSADICIQALVMACLWLFAVFAAGHGAVAKLPALVLVAIPIAFIAVQASRRLVGPYAFESAAFGTYGQALLVCLVTASLPAPLLSLLFSAIGLLLMLGVIVSAAIRLGLSSVKRRAKTPALSTAGQPAE
ncbi:MAG: hypothetical protein AAF337_07825 [Pseudomonadota bacterium]